ncbi:ubiquitin-conjugating enzyme E2 L3-like [Piliocolobus tephrosceles]|uniref:ubiquitin-conjugating enzyme E2 L3-like n=1 Tax=Piliocolobus tephrosceles TaxID=591936 RepID=UPI000E6B4413|nr:ubiquitin-conjugating enzyme E2 L3-like [Piliocolobus tephrosceles]
MTPIPNQLLDWGQWTLLAYHPLPLGSQDSVPVGCLWFSPVPNLSYLLDGKKKDLQVQKRVLERAERLRVIPLGSLLEWESSTKSKTATSRRLMKELEEIHKCGMRNFVTSRFEEANFLTWQGLIFPDNPPYDKVAVRMEIRFPAEYLFKPLKTTVKTKICHPNNDKKEQVCLLVISAGNWKPATKTDQVIQAVIALVNSPQPEHPFRVDLAEEYSKDCKKFFKNAEEFTKKYEEKRPMD